MAINAATHVARSRSATHDAASQHTLRIHVEVPIEQVKQLLAASERMSGDALELIAIDWQQHDLKVHMSLVTAMRREALRLSVTLPDVAHQSPGSREGRSYVTWQLAVVDSAELYSLEMQARACLHSADITEVWHRCLSPDAAAAASIVEACVAWHLSPGCASFSAAERRRGSDASYSSERADELASWLPTMPARACERAVEQSAAYTGASVDVHSFAQLLSRVCDRSPPEADIYRWFVDLGSGYGHAVLAAHALFPFRSCSGCDVVAEYVRCSLEQARRYRAGAVAGAGALNFVEADLTSFDWSAASVVFCHAVLWPPALLRDVAERAILLQPGALIVVAGKNDYDMIHHLARLGADVNARTRRDYTALLLAASRRAVKTVKALGMQGADLEVRSGELGWPALLTAAAKGFSDVVDVMAGLGASVEVSDDLGSPAIFLAAQQGHLATVQVLALHGADLRRSEGGHDLCNYYAARHPEVLAWCRFFAGKEEGDEDNGGGGRPFTPLHVAAALRRVDKIEALVRDGVGFGFHSLRSPTPFTIASEASGYPGAKAINNRAVQILTSVHAPWSPQTHRWCSRWIRARIWLMWMVHLRLSLLDDSPYFLPPELWQKVCQMVWGIAVRSKDGKGTDDDDLEDDDDFGAFYRDRRGFLKAKSK